MLRATRVLDAGDWSGDPAGAVRLDYDQRYRRRLSMVTDDGLEFLLDLPRAVALADGCALVLEDGRRIRVTASTERLVEVKAQTPELLARIAWHLGNRHLPTEIRDGALRIRDDHVVVRMLKGLGAELEFLDAPFQPEGGAYEHHHG